MCGITGFVDLSHQLTVVQLNGVIKKMSNTIIHRGPDDSGVWVDVSMGIALGHRRLSILDLSPGGHQPMLSYSGRYVITFNGEIYNHQEIKREIETHIKPLWQGHSDTEIMLTAIEIFGLEYALRIFTGMFAFALWDREEKILYIARDRIGEKPLYYGWMGNCFVFGSELKALKAHPSWMNNIDQDVIALYLKHSYIPAPYSIYRDIYKLMPGTFISMSASRIANKQNIAPIAYWSAIETVEKGLNNPFSGSEIEAIEQLEEILKTSIKQQMIADVALGAFLSGGIDSSTVVSLMQAQSSNPVKTFTIGLFEKNYDEAKYARAIAKHLKTDHTELYVTPKETMDVIPNLSTLYDEPFSDSSQIPTFIISQLTHKYVTVSLSGDGGDEIFGGYNRYLVGKNIWNNLKWIPDNIINIYRRIMSLLTPQIIDTLLNKLNFIIPKKMRQNNYGDKIQKFNDVIDAKTIDDLYLRLISHWNNTDAIVINSNILTTMLASVIENNNISDPICKMMCIDLITYLPDDILVKVDRAGMGVSLELRMPFLNHHVVEFAWSLPLSMKIRQWQSKWILRQILYRYVPQKMVDRPKMGFAIPIDTWLRGPLRDWAEHLLNEKKMCFFNPKPIQKKWHEHLTGKHNWQHHLWDILMFQSWIETNN
ncbi:MAG: asparagine synthase (glutamine-hydrolyzing) [Nitrospirae bacterium]|nr:asparagine synthase (glutamine-hydrolyzing) [Nitrospirota bacterium]MBF0554102.1 asparagine synthase (glutamine-hydrolyzing) [Nitrospirota bacterium]